MKNYPLHGTNLRNNTSTDKRDFARKMRNNPTEAERILWHYLKGRRLNDLKFKRQSIIRGWIADFWCPEVGLVVELDGSSHDDKEEADAFRDRTMNKLGIKVIRIQNQEVMVDVHRVLDRIAQACEE